MSVRSAPLTLEGVLFIARLHGVRQSELDSAMALYELQVMAETKARLIAALSAPESLTALGAAVLPGADWRSREDFEAQLRLEALEHGPHSPDELERYVTQRLRRRDHLRAMADTQIRDGIAAIVEAVAARV